ncbi:NACHT, LRR and PYD domains-containing protein 1-like isoform X2 [Tachysurus vachellii]|uniref:NACHT, LRR and PYD domains-containing protein 1-like isoform X2 n=1 Tax=Tachysurus vachellii TaxID=175792 RepID=UPI00296AE7A4|nr:NACHT, LRR and PYD domains-containing protein 1-like isoform X2 [Tachysurus vachellii]
MSFSSEYVSHFGENKGTEKGPRSKSPPHTYPRHPSADVSLQLQPFTPELVENCDKDEYRFFCPHAGQFMCNLTNIVFEMESEGEVKYKIMDWDSWLLNKLPRKEPAGPLYNIDGPEDSIRRLHFPHCEIGKGKAKLTVAHVTNDDVEVIQPTIVTDTHVIINVQSLSLFGLIFPCNKASIRAQVLLFYRKRTEHYNSKLHIHLLPANVPVKEVQKQHPRFMYIETTSSCFLTRRQNYRLCYRNNTENSVLQPEVVKFQLDCGPNYHPTFEILNIETSEVTLTLLDKKGKEVWTRYIVLLPGTELDPPNLDTTGADFVDQHRETLIQRVPAVMEVADCLESKKLITKEMYQNIQAKPTPQDKMREMYICLDSAGRAAKQEFYNILEMNHKFLVDELKSGQA